MWIPSLSYVCGNLAGKVKFTDCRLWILLETERGLLDSGPHREGAVSEAGSLWSPVVWVCGVGR